jgi:hypothetical protein
MNKIPAGELKLLYIDKKVIARNGGLPPIIIRIPDWNDKIIHCYKATILGVSEFLYTPADPLPPAGTYAYMATTSEVEYE